MRPLLAVVAPALLQHACAGNPVVPNVGMADPHVHFFNDMFYMYSTHDYAPNNTGFRMDDWWVWSSPDLVNWSKQSVLLPQSTPAPPGAYQECWATDAAYNGSHYAFYLSTGPTEVAVMVSEGPTGPWQDVLGVPLLNSSLGSKLQPSTQIRDPCAFRDPSDGALYLIFGTFNYYIARMEEDMVTLAEYPRYLTVLNPTGPYGNSTDDKPYMHSYGGRYYLSWGAFYGTGSSPYGPFTYQGVLTNTSYIDPSFRMNSTSGPWYGWEDLADRHGSVWTAHGQWYWSANDRSHSPDTAHPSYYRDTVLGFVNYYWNGSIAPVSITATGVGAYEGREGWQAEHYFKLRGRAHKVHDEQGRFAVHLEDSSAVLEYPHVRGVPASAVLHVTASNGGRLPSTLHLTHLTMRMAPGGGYEERELCPLGVEPTGDWDAFQDFTCTFSVAGPEHYSELHLVVRASTTGSPALRALSSASGGMQPQAGEAGWAAPATGVRIDAFHVTDAA